MQLDAETALSIISLVVSIISATLCCIKTFSIDLKSLYLNRRDKKVDRSEDEAARKVEKLTKKMTSEERTGLRKILTRYNEKEAATTKVMSANVDERKADEEIDKDLYYWLPGLISKGLVRHVEGRYFIKRWVIKGLKKSGALSLSRGLGIDECIKKTKKTLIAAMDS